MSEGAGGVNTTTQDLLGTKKISSRDKVSNSPKGESVGANLSENSPGEVKIEDVDFNDIPRKLKDLAPFLLGDDLTVEKFTTEKGEVCYIFTFPLKDSPEVESKKTLTAKVVVPEDKVESRAFRSVGIAVQASGENEINLDKYKDPDSRVDIIVQRGSPGALPRHEYELDRTGVPRIQMSGFKTTFDLLSYLHEGKHTMQSTEILQEVENGSNKLVRIVSAYASEVNAWEINEAVSLFGLSPEQTLDIKENALTGYLDRYDMDLSRSHVVNRNIVPTLGDAQRVIGDLSQAEGFFTKNTQAS